jgi:small redox-active disulfide protein 2
MEIKILGTGCPKCKTLEKMTREIIEKEDIDASVSKEEDIMKIMAYGVLHTPGLVIDGKVVFSGRLPSRGELSELLTGKK